MHGSAPPSVPAVPSGRPSSTDSPDRNASRYAAIRGGWSGGASRKTTGTDLSEYEGQTITETDHSSRIDTEVKAVREQYAEEAAEAAEAEIAEKNPALDVPLNYRPCTFWYCGTKLLMRITWSARRHGVSDEAVRHAVANAIRLVDTDDGLFIIGADLSGQLLELIARPVEAGDLVVFHAMPLRPVNAQRYLP